MARKSRRSYRSESTREPFELELETPPEGHPGYVTFLDPNRIPTISAFDLARAGDSQEVLQHLLSEEDYKVWWAEWAAAPVEETRALIEDVQKHYGVDPGKLPR